MKDEDVKEAIEQAQGRTLALMCAVMCLVHDHPKKDQFATRLLGMAHAQGKMVQGISAALGKRGLAEYELSMHQLLEIAGALPRTGQSDG